MKEMPELAENAVEGAKIWGLELDYSAESLESLEKLAHLLYREHRIHSIPEHILDGIAELYGAYLGEVLLRSGLKDLDFAWAENEEGGIGIGREDMWAAPVNKVYKRITNGPGDDLTSFGMISLVLAGGKMVG